jgi:hypothetical protein
MGWWKEKAKDRELLFGDEPMDLVHELVAAFSKSYVDDVGRKPPLEEFRRTLQHTLGGDPGRYFADMDTAVVGDVVFRVKKVPKRQQSAVGDYFAIPLEGKYWYGRIIHIGAAGHLVEIYDLQSDRLLGLPELLGRKPKVVLNKNVFSLPCFTRARWRIIGPADVPKDFKYPCFYGGLVAYGRYSVWEGKEEYSVEKDEAMRYEPSQVWWPERIEAALRAREFGEWPEVTESKKGTFGRHDEAVKFMNEYFNLPEKPPPAKKKKAKKKKRK